jgi:MFS transporter, SP family, galactose:H+ symporter
MDVQSGTPTSKPRSPGFVELTAGIAALAGLLFGFDTGIISGAILFIKTEFHLAPLTEEFLVSAALIGAVCGCVLSGRVTDAIGRRSTILITAGVFSVGSIVSAIAPNVGLLIVGRLAVGLAIGVASYAAPLYIGEIAPPNLRGGLVTLNQLAITGGILLSYVVDALFAPNQSWRWMLASGVLPAIALELGVVFLPESPRWLLLHGFRESATKTLARIRATEDNRAEIDEILEHAQTGSGKIADLLRPMIMRVIFLGAGLAVIQQVTGINTVIYYAPTIFQAAGFQSAQASITATAGVGLVNVIMTIVAIPLVDRVGRRPLLLSSLTGMLLSLVLLAIGFALGGPALKWIGVFSLVVYIASFAIGLGPVFWLLISEIFPLNIRGQAASIATTANWLSNFFVSLTFLSLLNGLGNVWTFLLYAVLSAAGLWYCFALVPETKGVPLERIERNLRSGRKLRELASLN